MRTSLTIEERQKLTELKMRLINAKTDEERYTMLAEIEQLLNKGRQRHKFLSTLDIR